MPGLPACLAWACPSNELASMLRPSCCPLDTFLGPERATDPRGKGRPRTWDRGGGPATVSFALFPSDACVSSPPTHLKLDSRLKVSDTLTLTHQLSSRESVDCLGPGSLKYVNGNQCGPWAALRYGWPGRQVLRV